jgi:hypothetical protein
MLLRKMLLIGKVDNTLSKKIIEIAFTAHYADGDFVASDSEPVTPFPGLLHQTQNLSILVPGCSNNGSSSSPPYSEADTI